MFGKKAKAEIDRLKTANYNLNRRLEEWETREKDRKTAVDAANTQLVRDLREMDQLVYQMSQSGNAEQLRSAVARAWYITEKRMQAESARIAGMLIPEIKKVYSRQEENVIINETHPAKRLR